MNQENVYQICKNLGMKKDEIRYLLDINTNEKKNLTTSINSPVNSYKDPFGGRYGTVSVKDF